MTPDTPAGLPGRIPQRQYSAVALAPGREFAVAFDPQMGDPITTAYISLMGHVLDRNLVDLMLALSAPGETIVDLGAFIGTFGLAAAAMDRKVVAVEASFHNVSLLRASASRNRFRNFAGVHAAVSDSFGTLQFHSDGPYGQIAEAGSEAGTESVPAVRMETVLHRLGWQPVTFIKMDVEGSEMKCLSGMESFLTGPGAPPVLFESNVYGLYEFGYEPADLLARMHGLGYKTYLVDDVAKRLIRTRPGELQATTVVNYLAIKEPPDIEGWPVDEEMSLEDRAVRVATEAAWEDPRHRAGIARSLRKADPGLLAHPGVAEAVERLTQDPDESVKRAARGEEERPAPPDSGGPGPDDAAAAEAVLREAVDGMNEALWADIAYLHQVIESLRPAPPPPSPQAPAPTPRKRLWKPR